MLVLIDPDGIFPRCIENRSAQPIQNETEHARRSTLLTAGAIVADGIFGSLSE